MDHELGGDRYDRVPKGTTDMGALHTESRQCTAFLSARIQSVCGQVTET